MNLKPLHVLLTLCVGLFSFGFSATAVAATPPPPARVVPLGDNTYSITCTAKNGFQRDTDVLKARAQEQAEKFCASEGKQLKLVSLTADRPLFAMGYASAKIVFKALVPGAPELSGEATSAPRPRTTDDLYAELTKLDELRKKGILTEEEFQSEKTKVLNRSK